MVPRASKESNDFLKPILAFKPNSKSNMEFLGSKKEVFQTHEFYVLNLRNSIKKFKGVSLQSDKQSCRSSEEISHYLYIALGAILNSHHPQSAYKVSMSKKYLRKVYLTCARGSSINFIYVIPSYYIYL